MKKFLTLLLAIGCVASAFGQASVTRNGLIVQQASLQFTTPITSGIFLMTGSLNAVNVAIGVTPFVELEVDSTSTSSPRGIMSAQFSTGTDGARLHLRKARGTRAVPTTVVTGDNLGRVVATGYDGSNYLEMGSIIFGTEGTVASTRVPTNLQFYTATDAAPSVLTERGRFTSAGNLLLGSTSDDAVNKLQVTGSVVATSYVITPTTLTYSATTDIPFTAGDRNLTLGGNITFTGSSMAAGRNVDIFITCDATPRTFVFPAWIWVGGTAPTGIAASKHGVLSLRSRSTTDGAVWAMYAVEP